MKKLRFLLTLILSAALALTPALALAEVKLSASSDKSSVTEGDTLEVTITVTGKDMSVARGVFSYDPSLLTYTEGDGGVSDGFITMMSAEKDGADQLSARIVFTAAGGGEAKVDFTLEEVLDYDGDGIGSATAGVTVSVTALPQEPEKEQEPISYARYGVPAQNVSGATEAMYVWKSLENVTIPSKYSVTTLDYHGTTVEAAIVADSDAPTLLYVSNDTGDVGSYHIYNQAADTLFPYRTLSSVSKSYIIMQPDGSVPVPAGFTETTLTVDERPMTAWVSTDAQGEVYLVYARNPDGEVGFYAYNLDDESLQRYSVLPARPVQPTLQEQSPAAVPATPSQTEGEGAEAGKEGLTLGMPVLIAIGGVILLLIIVIVAMAVSQARERARRRKRAAQRRAQRERAMEQEQ